MMAPWVGLLVGLCYLFVSFWLTLKILRMFIGPLMTSQPSAKTQLFITDYYVLLGQIALSTGIMAPRYSGDPAEVAVLIANCIGLGLLWFTSTRMLSRQRVKQFWPRLVGQFLFPIQFGIALFSGFATLPWLIMLFVDAKLAAIVVGATVVFVFLVWAFTQSTRWTLEHADPLEPNPMEVSNVPPA